MGNYIGTEGRCLRLFLHSTFFSPQQSPWIYLKNYNQMKWQFAWQHYYSSCSILVTKLVSSLLPWLDPFPFICHNLILRIVWNISLLINKTISSFAVTNSATKYDQELVDSALNYMVWHNIIKNHPNSKSDPYLVNSKINPFVHNATYL